MNEVLRMTGVRSMTTAFLVFAILASSSMFTFAAPNLLPALGEISVTGARENGNPPTVLINGQPAVSGSTFASSGLIETSAASAAVNLGNAGRVSVMPNSSLILNFSENTITGKLLTGRVTVLNAKGVTVRIETPDNLLTNNSRLQGNFTVDIQSGKTVAAADSGEVFYNDGLPAAQAQTPTASGGGAWIPVAVFAAIVGTAVTYVVLKRNDEDDNIVSPVR